MRDVYTTIAGDTWDLIAFKVYGHERYMEQLLAANPAHLQVARFGAGVEIVCPDIQVATSNSLPPWKAVANG